MAIDIFVDGGARPNPGLGVAGIVCRDVEEYQIREDVTNNEMEYLAVKLALEMFTCSDESKCTIYTDSQLVVGHLTKGWKCTESLIPHRDIIKNLLKSLMYQGKSVTIQKISREKNAAHKVVDKGFDEYGT